MATDYYYYYYYYYDYYYYCHLDAATLAVMMSSAIAAASVATLTNPVAKEIPATENGRESCQRQLGGAPWHIAARSLHEFPWALSHFKARLSHPRTKDWTHALV